MLFSPPSFFGNLGREPLALLHHMGRHGSALCMGHHRAEPEAEPVLAFWLEPGGKPVKAANAQRLIAEPGALAARSDGLFGSSQTWKVQPVHFAMWEVKESGVSPEEFSRGINGLSFARIDRKTPLGNPYTVEEHGREECVRLHRESFLAGRLAPHATTVTIKKIVGRNCLCHCHRGLACHGDVYIESANA